MIHSKVFFYATMYNSAFTLVLVDIFASKCYDSILTRRYFLASINQLVSHSWHEMSRHLASSESHCSDDPL
jgi:hypothetical protein